MPQSCKCCHEIWQLSWTLKEFFCFVWFSDLLFSLRKIPKFHLISWSGSFVETQSLRRVSDKTERRWFMSCFFVCFYLFRSLYWLRYMKLESWLILLLLFRFWSSFKYYLFITFILLFGYRDMRLVSFNIVFIKANSSRKDLFWKSAIK